MRIEMEFAYQAEIDQPPGFRTRANAGPYKRWFFGRETVEFSEVGSRDFPVALRDRPRKAGGNVFARRTDGVQMFYETVFDLDLLTKMSTAYSQGVGQVLLRRWFGDGRLVHAGWNPSPEEELRLIPKDTPVRYDREAARSLMHRRVADCAVLEGKLWKAGGWDVTVVLPPGSRIPGQGPKAITKVPRHMRLSFGERALQDHYVAAFAARDLLFYPGEEQQAWERAIGIDRRAVELDREIDVATLPRYPDFSALSMASWVDLVGNHLCLDETPAESVMVVPYEEPDKCRLLRPADLVGPIQAFLKLYQGPSTTRQLMPAFSAIAAAFGSTIETNALANRRDITELLEVHGRILRRAEQRPDRRAAAAWSQADDVALGELGEQEAGQSSVPGP